MTFSVSGRSTSNHGVEANVSHEAYFFCYDNNDSDVVSVFQLYTDMASMQEFLSGAWYAEYLKDISQVVAAPPQIAPATLVWAKGSNEQTSDK